MSSVFITGTDTGVGKTVVTASICVASGAQPMKPVQTGSLEAQDLAFTVSVTGRPMPEQTACPYRFAEPLAPAVAARRAGVPVDLAHIRRCYDRLWSRGPVAVEGAGGLLVEVAGSATMADLARLLGLPIVIACRPGLGTLNHTALTIEAARRRGLEVMGLVIVGWPEQPGIADRTNPPELARHAPIIGVIPHIAGLDTERRVAGPLAQLAARSLAPSLGGTFDADAFLRGLR